MEENARPNAAVIDVRNGNKKLLIYLHGCSSTPALFTPFVFDALAAGYDVYAPVYPGHCTTPEDMLSHGYGEWLAAAKAALEENLPRYEAIRLCGHSLGGALAGYLAGAYAKTGKIEAALLMCPGFSLADKSLYDLTYEKAGTGFFGFRAGPVHAPEMTPYGGGYDLMHFKTVVDLENIGPLCTAELPKIACPTAVWIAGRDFICDTKEQRSFALTIPTLTELKIFPDSGHNVLTDAEYREAHARLRLWIAGGKA